MPSMYLVTEPERPAVSFIRCGRGGAGNTLRTAVAPSSSSPSPSLAPPSAPAAVPSPSASSSAQRFFTGIGGAGNVRPAAPASASASFADAVRLAASRDHPPPVGHCGRGGAGNVYQSLHSHSRRASSTSGDSSSARSSMSSTAKLWARVSGKV